MRNSRPRKRKASDAKEEAKRDWEGVLPERRGRNTELEDARADDLDADLTDARSGAGAYTSDAEPALKKQPMTWARATNWYEHRESGRDMVDEVQDKAKGLIASKMYSMATESRRSSSIRTQVTAGGLAAGCSMLVFADGHSDTGRPIFVGPAVLHNRYCHCDAGR